MTSEQKVAELQRIIERELTPLINHDYVLWGVPYHTNIGDILIWQGELDFLSQLPHHCRRTCSWDAYPDGNLALDKDTVILIHGGGYFGDTWRDGWEMVLDGIKHYPDNPVIIMPQTIYYADETLLEQDKALLSKMKRLTICARDNVSYAFAQKHFSSFARVILVPDMAFCISTDRLRKWAIPSKDRSLYLKRMDKESAGAPPMTLDATTDVRDWPTVDNRGGGMLLTLGKALYKFWWYEKNAPQGCLGYKLANWGMAQLFRPTLIRLGVRFVSGYRRVRTTRLHVLILSVLLGKDVVSEDNSYGKLSSFYETWLDDVDNVSIDCTAHGRD